MKLYVSGFGENLVLFFLGYGQDPRPFLALNNSLAQNSALALVYDYEDAACDFTYLQKFSLVRVIAWSMGVMFAPRIVEKLGVRLERCFAVNGTVEGIDDELGIPKKAWDKTLADLSDEKHAELFYRLMCRNPRLSAQYLENKPERTVESLRQELKFIRAYALTKEAVSPAFYTKALVSSRDVIMPPLAVKRSFSSAGVELEERCSSHYDPEIFNQLISLPF